MTVRFLSSAERGFFGVRRHPSLPCLSGRRTEGSRHFSAALASHSRHLLHARVRISKPLNSSWRRRQRREACRHQRLCPPQTKESHFSRKRRRRFLSKLWCGSGKTHAEVVPRTHHPSAILGAGQEATRIRHHRPKILTPPE
jgi:hypothetical protein